ncbi:hypothetical protein [Pradoshia sp.]
METIALLGFIPLLINLGILIFSVYVAVTIIKIMKQKNEYLREIRDEMRKNNRVN